MSTYYDIIIIGSQPAACVAADACVQKGMRVYWSKGPKKAGGIFRGITLEGKIWDAGMNLLEFTAMTPEGAPQDLKSYDPTQRYDAVRFLPEIRSYLSTKMQWREVTTPEMAIEDMLYPDFLIANQTEYLQTLDIVTREKIISELGHISAFHPLHAAQKNTSAVFESTTYAEVALLNHGNILHKLLIEPWIESIAGEAYYRIPAKYHRQIWAPLWYPETLVSLLTGKSLALPTTRFHYPLGERFGAWLGRLEDSMMAHTNLTLTDQLPQSLRYQNQAWEIRLEDSYIQGSHVYFCDDLNALTTESFDLERGKIGFIAFEIRDAAHDFSVLNLVNAPFGIFRLTNQSHLMGEGEGEYQQYMAEFSGTSLPDAADLISLLLRLGILWNAGDFRWVQLLPPIAAFPLPTYENLERFSSHQREIQMRYPKLYLGGTASSITSISLNEQIVQGLSFSEIISHEYF
jgi:hypothetical protein